jgi:hypothetical protein
MRKGVFIAQMDGSFVLATNAKIASEFGQLSNSSWIIVSYSLAMCAVQPCVSPSYHAQIDLKLMVSLVWEGQ